ncbi:hypothetical protein [Pseudodesulfovibrio alkaliphilus]|uniref:hypothetical protein n=1 Tax=Pseudodesulfovibrio alkaliphilus TaxID=2661613 RepID=UPI0018C8BCD5|nr:hypothetical protein [Pseudodesulfovibrio alkaliphilus]
MYSLRLVLMAAMVLVFSVRVFAFEGLVQPMGEGGAIAWGSGEVEVVRALEQDGDGGEPTPLAVRMAVGQARKRLLDIILAVRVDARGTVSSYLADDEDAAARLRSLVQNSPLKRPAMFDDAGEVRVFERLRGPLAELVLPTSIQFQSGIPPRMPSSMEGNMAFESEGMPEEAGIGVSGFTGIIVDARGLRVTPAMAPVIYGQDGLGAYGPFLVSRASAIASGVAVYAVTDDRAVLRERVGENPLTVRALSTFGSWRTDLVVSSPMAALIRAMMRVGDAVDQCRVVIVIDPFISDPGAAPVPDAPLPQTEE